MSLPFTLNQFLDVFRRYNEAVWPAQLMLFMLALLAIVAAVRGGANASRTISAILVALWTWTAIAYHLTFFRVINPAAIGFASLFLAEAILLAWMGVYRGALVFDARRKWPGRIGGAMIVYALLVYPSIGRMLGHVYPSAPTFGVPCPTTIFTFGMFVWLVPPRPRAIMILPMLWSLLGLSAAFTLGMWEDVGLIVAAIIATATGFYHQRSDSHATADARVSFIR